MYETQEISLRNVPNGTTFSEFPFVPEIFQWRTNQKNVYYLHPNRNFREFVVNGQQPLSLSLRLSPQTSKTNESTASLSLAER